MRESRKLLKWRMKIFLAVLVVSALTVLTTGETIRVQAATVTEVQGGITYSCDTGRKDATIISANNADLPSNLIIPSSITVDTETYSVTQINNNAFKNCSILQSVTTPKELRIKNSAFSGCTGLQSATLSGGAIYDRAFEGCSSLQTVTLSDNVADMGYSVFKGCTSLTTFTLPEGTSLIRNSTFEGCANLQSITIPGSVTFIGTSVFSGCDNLKTVNFTGTQEQWDALTGGMSTGNDILKSNSITIEVEKWVTTETTHQRIKSISGTVVIAEEAHEWENGVCKECGYACAHQWNAATCKQARTCSYCGALNGVANSDNHAGTLQWVTTETTHKQVYDCCGAVVVAEEAHEWENKVCKKCGYADTTVAAPIEYEILEGAGGSWTRNSQEGLRVRGSGEFAKFTGAKVDGTALDAGAYTVAEGSTIITLKTAYLNTLSEGSHTLEIIWTDGTAHVSFTVAADVSGSTGSASAGSSTGSASAGSSTESGNESTNAGSGNAGEVAVKSPATGEEGSLYLPLAALLVLAAGLVGAGAAGRRGNCTR